MIAKQARRKYLWHPLNWPSWCLAACLYPFAFLPYSLQKCLGRRLGQLCFKTMSRRRHIAATNIKLCFPEWTQAQRDELLYKSFLELGLTLVETNMTWWRKPDSQVFKQPIKMNGFEALQREHELGHGVLIIGAHFSTIDIAGCLMGQYLPLTVTMRRLKNPVFDYIFKRARKPLYKGMLDRTELKGMLKTLSHGGMLWYAADQDYGPDNSVFVPFFKQQAASLRITPKLIAKTKAKVFFGSHYRRDDHFEMNVYPLTEPFPTDDLKADVALINRHIEKMILECPEQYLWIHRRFKTTEHGKKSEIYNTELANNLSS